VKDPEYAHVKKKPEREPIQRPPVGVFLLLFIFIESFFALGYTAETTKSAGML
jgi:hypothetical protein